MLTMECQDCDQYKERGGDGRCQNRGQTSRKVAIIRHRLEERNIVCEIRRRCDSQPRSGDHFDGSVCSRERQNMRRTHIQ